MNSVVGPGRVLWQVWADYPATPDGRPVVHLSAHGHTDVARPVSTDQLGAELVASLAGPELDGRTPQIRIVARAVSSGR
ncbi:hypothetical protein [Streptomyces antimicrobicus]|uniref:Uncharacterized protein n=1 Tax=Streptomyces antimicrobicus TaxID=2883108 RepID=A0ABS8BB98_9ACTN|nr:hypothetical protein [Streptomyces antimicrobicus]MCB5181885.1 hypothetical protein [Streptomyces antimicrobicus]